MCVGGAFYSGTLEALVFDSLKQEGNESKFVKVVSNMSSISLLAPAICSIIGGFVYGFDPRLPFILNAIGYTFGLIATFFLIEPNIDTIKFSFTNYLSQTKAGLFELFKNVDVRRQTIVLLDFGFIAVIYSEMVDIFLRFEFGYSDKQMGILWSVIFIFSAFASQFTSYIKKTFGINKSIVIVGIATALTYLVSPYAGLILGGLTLILRSSFQGVFGNLTSIEINNSTDSKYRSTTLSTFNMIKNMPYVLTAYFIGGISDTISAKTVSFYLGLALIFLLGISFVRRNRNATI
jgi:hypothetical protein